MTAKNWPPKIEYEGNRSCVRIHTTAKKRRTITLGPTGSPEANERYERLKTIMEANDQYLPDEELPQFRSNESSDPELPLSPPDETSEPDTAALAEPAPAEASTDADPASPPTETASLGDGPEASAPIEEVVEPPPPVSQEDPPTPEHKPAPKTITIDGRTFSLPFHDLFRLLHKPERDKLRAVLDRGDGFHEPPVYVDEHDAVIDGGHRLGLVAESGRGLGAVTIKELRGLTEEQKLARAYDLNDARRQLSASDLENAREERKRRVAELRQQGKSLRAIAEEVGVSKSQVELDLKEHVEAPGVQGWTPGTDGTETTPAAAAVIPETPTPEVAAATPAVPETPPTITGLDGKSYKAKSKPQPKPSSKLESQPSSKPSPRLPIKSVLETIQDASRALKGWSPETAEVCEPVLAKLRKLRQQVQGAIGKIEELLRS